MKKTLILVGMLSMGYAYAQKGNVGINTPSPNATLEVKVANANSSNDTNQGVLIPKLSKTRVAAIADGKLVKGTLVFVEGITYAGTNAKVVDINADGFYYYNGTKWVKVEGSVLPSGNANGQVLKWNGSSWIVGTDNDTKYTAGTGLSLSGTTFSANPAGIALGGDVTGNANVNKVTKIQGRPVDGVTVPTAGQVLKWIDNQWKPANDENTNTQYSAGTGLNLTGTAFSVNYGTTAGTAVQGNDTRVNNGQTAFSWGNHATAGYLKTLPIASATQLGGVKVGTNLNITADGVLSATDTNTTYTAGNGLTLTGTEFSLPIATSGTGNVVTGITQTANGITVTKANVVDTNTTYTAGTGITISGTNNAIAVNPSGVALGGDVTGNANANTVAKIQGRAVANTAPTNGQVLKWVNNQWTPSNDDNTNTTYAGSTSVILSSGSFQRAALTGDVTSPQNSNALTISPNAVTSDKIANGTIKGEDIAPATITADKLVAGVIPTDTNTNIYTNDGTLSTNRKVTTGANALTIEGTAYHPLQINANNGTGNGGLVIRPMGNQEKRVEMNTTPEGNLRLWAGTDLLYGLRNGNVGIGTSEPRAKLDVLGGIRANQGLPNSDAANVGYAFGNDGDTGLFSEMADNPNVAKNLSLYTNSVSRIFIKNDGGAVGIGTTDPKSKLDVEGDILARGINGSNVQAYFGGDQFSNDVELGSLNADIKTVSLYNRTAGESMNLSTNNISASGNITVNGLAGTGDRVVLADATGVLKTGTLPATSVSGVGNLTGGTEITVNNGNGSVLKNVDLSINSVSGAKITNGTITANKLAPGVIPTDTNTNIYTNDGTLSGARTVTMGTHNLLFVGTGKMGVGTTSPAAKFDVIGGIRSSKGEGVLDNSNVGYAFSEDGDTGMFAVGGHANLGSDLVLKNDNVTAVTIKTGTRNVGIHTNNPTERLEVNGSIKSSALSGTGNRNVVADSTGKLVIGQAATPIRTVTASTTIAATDDKGYVYVETSGATTITVPNTLPAGFSCVIIQQGDGQVTIAGSGVTLQTARGTKTRAKFSAVGVIKRTADTATITGDAVN